MKHTLFLVHGMGRHDENWWKEPWAQLCELSEGYRFFDTRKLEDLVEPVGLRYDDKLVGALTRWTNEGTTFADFAKSQELRFAGDVSWLSELADDDPGFELSHVADVVIYRLFALEANRIRDHIKAEMAQVIADRKAEDAEARFSVLAHSLGTAVVHDALAELGTLEELDGKLNTFRAGQFSFRSIHMLSNVSRLAQTDQKVYQSVVRPGDRDSAVTYCLNYTNYNHELDPFALIRPFRPVGFGSRYEDVQVRHVHAANVHGLAHYLANPRVHVPILNSVTRSSAIRKKEFGEHVAANPRFVLELDGVDAFRGEVAELGRLAQLIDADEPLGANVGTFLDMWKTVGRLKDVVLEELGT